jgi:hypothetical protein
LADLRGGPLGQRNEVYRLAPFRRLINTSRGHHLADDKGQQVGGVLPADEVEALERFVYEVERVSAICKDAVGLAIRVTPSKSAK